MKKSASEVYMEIEERDTNKTIEYLDKYYDDPTVEAYKKCKESDKVIDMHTHTTASDGEIEPDDLLWLALKKK